MVTVSILSSYEALKKGWNFQPSFQRQTKPSKALASALKMSAHNEALVIPVMLRNNEIGDGRKRMLVLQDWLANEKNPPKDTFASDWKRLLEGTQVVVCDYDLPLADFLVEFEHHNQVNERMSGGELLNAQFHVFPEDVAKLILNNRTFRKHRRLKSLSFLGYLLTGLKFNARTSDVLKKMAELKDSLSAAQVDKCIKTLVNLDAVSEQIAFAVKDSKLGESKVRKPTGKNDQATLLRLLEKFDTSGLRGDFEQLRDGWIRYVEATKDKVQRESTGEDYTTLAGCLGLVEEVA
jgi:hypothetical protein